MVSKAYRVKGSCLILNDPNFYWMLDDKETVVSACSPEEAIQKARVKLKIEAWLYGVRAIPISEAERMRIEGYKELP